jgi:hypothetical protein
MSNAIPTGINEYCLRCQDLTELTVEQSLMCTLWKCRSCGRTVDVDYDEPDWLNEQESPDAT